MPKRLLLEIAGGILLLIFIIMTVSRVPKGKYEELKNKYEKLNSNYSALQTDSNDLKSDNASLKENLEKLTSEYESYKTKMKPFEEMSAAQAEAEKVKAEQEKAAAEQAAAEQKAAEEAEAAKAAEEAAATKAAEEAQGYETGISYDQLARTPDDFMGKKVKFQGKVLQVIEGTSSIQIRLAVDKDYDTILLGEYTSSIVSSRILEDDIITIYGTSVGTISYKSTMGGTITIPGVYIDKIDQ